MEGWLEKRSSWGEVIFGGEEFDLFLLFGVFHGRWRKDIYYTDTE
jgi:hypothetical protein